MFGRIPAKVRPLRIAFFAPGPKDEHGVSGIFARVPSVVGVAPAATVACRPDRFFVVFCENRGHFVPFRFIPVHGFAHRAERRTVERVADHFPSFHALTFHSRETIENPNARDAGPHGARSFGFWFILW